VWLSGLSLPMLTGILVWLLHFWCFWTGLCKIGPFWLVRSMPLWQQIMWTW
jgi:hypothetical protein